MEESSTDSNSCRCLEKKLKKDDSQGQTNLVNLKEIKEYPPPWGKIERKLQEKQEVTKGNQEGNPGMVGQYTYRGGIEPLDFIKSNFMSFIEGNIVKYLYRYKFKGGVGDLRKAKFYIELLIKEYVE